MRGMEWYRAFVPYRNLTLPQDPKSYIEGKISPETNNYNVGGRLSYKPDEKNYLYFDAIYADQWINNTRPDIYRLSADKNIHARRNNLILTHLGSYAFGKTNTSIQYNATHLISKPVNLKINPAYKEFRGDDIIVNAKLVTTKKEIGKFTFGGRYRFRSIANNIVASNHFFYRNDMSLFIENESAIANSLFLTLSIRENYDPAFGFNTSPSAYLVYNASDSLTFKGGISTGYKTPDANQLTDGIYDYSKSGKAIYGNPNLKPENSMNIEFSILNETTHTNVGLIGFYNLFNNKITSSGTLPQNAPLPKGICQNPKGCQYSINAGNAKTYGTEFFFSLKTIDISFGKIDFDFNYTFTRSLITSGSKKGLPLTNVPKHNMNATLKYSFSKIGFYLRSEYKAKQLYVKSGIATLKDLQNFRTTHPHLGIYYKPYFLLHLGGNYDFTKSIRLNFGIYNLLNHNFVDYTKETEKGKAKWFNNYAYIHQGRRYFVSLNMDF
ncbi:hypothetical protein BKH41_05305 [Helicobacter sp. 12S02232-10]|uniref:TonB-dependent receptor domain-containing protein n=1 Tax=Helicobacter sp. 12S02232-10 TaxID=1476197 RepID=UPI000BC89816|nr:TonB-dependent receptor [Helicobacter sp. 12S02232-10]PAF48687.1 hypothetical protein BKH41_05305 [Helicobacter sp. 12S02232-10]